MKRTSLFLASSTVVLLLGQSPNDKLVSLEVGQDGSVTYRLYAPQAREVKLNSEGPEAVPHATPADVAKSRSALMTRGSGGVWSLRMGPFPAGAYRYSFNVDGVETIDPRNPDVSESLNSVRSLTLVPGSYMDRKDVPHGAIETLWYPSATAMQNPIT